MSMLLLALLVADDPMTAYRRITSVERRCEFDPNATDITVCGLRNADRFRVSLQIDDPDDPANEAVAMERERLLARTSPIEELSPFLVGGGMAGVTVSTRGGVAGYRARKLAP